MEATARVGRVGNAGDDGRERPPQVGAALAAMARASVAQQRAANLLSQLRAESREVALAIGPLYCCFDIPWPVAGDKLAQSRIGEMAGCMPASLFFELD